MAPNNAVIVGTSVGGTISVILSFGVLFFWYGRRKSLAEVSAHRSLPTARPSYSTQEKKANQAIDKNDLDNTATSGTSLPEKSNSQQKRQPYTQTARYPCLASLNLQNRGNHRRGRAARIDCYVAGSRVQKHFEAWTLKDYTDLQTASFFSEHTELVILEDVGAE
jgi:hypothetical protein